MKFGARPRCCCFWVCKRFLQARRIIPTYITQTASCFLQIKTKRGCPKKYAPPFVHNQLIKSPALLAAALMGFLINVFLPQKWRRCNITYSVYIRMHASSLMRKYTESHGYCCATCRAVLKLLSVPIGQFLLKNESRKFVSIS